MLNTLTVKSVKATNNRLTVNFSCKGQIRKYLEDDQFFADYDTSIEKVPEALLVIPFLAFVCPIAWANQTDVYVETVDQAFLRSLNHAQSTFQRFYPRMEFSGSIKVENVAASEADAQKNAMMLYTGGVDSLATYIRHQNETPILASIHNADVDLDEKPWSRKYFRTFIFGNEATKYLKAFADQTSSKLRIVKSNFLNMLDGVILGAYNDKIEGYWYSRVLHGLAFLGLCAPLTHVDKVGKLYIASSHTASYSIPWGSHPEIDNYVRWAGTRVIHDGYELGRQQKIDLIADYIRNKKHRVHISSCFVQKKAENCSLCEKCSRTILGLELAGINPNEHGFTVEANTFIRIKENLENGSWTFGDDEQYMWADLKSHAQRNVVLPHPQAKELIDWLAKVDVKTLRTKPPRQRRVVPLFKRLPYPVYSITKRLYMILLELVYYRKNEN